MSVTVSNPAPRPRRSALYVPASNPRAIAKARTLPADCVILDLEDSVAPDAKVAARAAAVAAVAEGGWGRREIVIRVNGEDTEWGRDDMLAAAGSGADAVLLPKVADGPAVVRAAALLSLAGAHDGQEVWGMIESAAAVESIFEIASAHRRQAVLVLGLEDLALDMRIPRTPGREGLLYSISRTLVAARANGLDVLDGVFVDIADSAGLEAACRQSRALGLDGRTAIHPAQIDIINRELGPSPAEIADARAVIAAFTAARAEGKGVVALDGKMIEHLHVRIAERVLAMVEAANG